MPPKGDLPELKRLRTLADSGPPAELTAYALKLIQARRNHMLVIEALHALAAVDLPDPAARPVLVEQFAYYQQEGPRRDPSSPIRVAILQALHPLATVDDIPLLETAAQTYEHIPPGMWEEAGVQRATALIVLAGLDRDLGAYHAARILSEDARTLSGMMSGDPGKTAIRVLAGQGHFLPIYAYLIQGKPDGVSEAIAEALRCMTVLPPSLLPALITKYLDSTSEMVIGGLFDLLIAHESRATHADRMLVFLRSATNHSLYRYLLTALVASRRNDMLQVVLRAAEGEQDRRKVAALIETLELVAKLPGVEPVLEMLRGG